MVLGLSWSLMEQASTLSAAGAGTGWETAAHLCHFQVSLFSGRLVNMQIPPVPVCRYENFFLLLDEHIVLCKVNL